MRHRTRSALRLALLVSLTAVVLGAGTWVRSPAPARAGDKDLPRVTVVVRDGAVDAPTAVPTGFVAFTFQNATAEPLFAPLVRLNAGATLAAVQAAMAEDDVPAFTRLVTALGGPAGTAPGQRQEIVVNLQPGSYVAAAFTEAGPTLAAFAAVPPPVTTEPPAAAPIVLGDFFFEAPAIRAGTQTFQVSNRGQQLHHLIVARLAAGVTLADVFAAEAAGTDPLEAGLVEVTNGLSELSPNQTAWPTLSFTPGSYAMVCFIEDPDSGQEHVALGMALEFTVR